MKFRLSIAHVSNIKLCSIHRHDILTYLYTSVHPETRVAYMMEFLFFYYTTASTSLRKLGIDLLEEGYTFESFYEDYRTRCGQALLPGIAFIQGIYDDKHVDEMKKASEEMKNEGNFFKNQLSNKMKVKIECRLLKKNREQRKTKSESVRKMKKCSRVYQEVPVFSKIKSPVNDWWSWLVMSGAFIKKKL